MKARIKATGQLIDVIELNKSIYRSSNDRYYKECVESTKSYDPKELDFEDTIDWESRRFELIKIALMSLNQDSMTTDISRCISIADQLIDKLRKYETE